MWDNNAPLQLLKTMPKVLENEHLEKLQMLLQADKYKNQIISGNDLCGAYAPFCEGCDKGKKHPCAVAYVNFIRSVGLDIKIADREEDSVSEQGVQESFFEPSENISEESPVLGATKEVVTAEEKQSGGEVASKEKLKIRIAIAKKKTLR